MQFRPPGGPRVRVVSDNDYSGDPDGLYQLVHLLLSPSVDVRGVIGSHLAPGDPFDSSEHTAAHAVREIRGVLDVLGRDVEAGRIQPPPRPHPDAVPRRGADRARGDA